MEETKKRRYCKYLPIGTVVLLKNAKKRIMITGFCAVSKEKGGEKEYDYSGVLYPEGMISTKETLLFNHKQIAKIYHLGLFKDKEEQEFKIKLKSQRK